MTEFHKATIKRHLEESTVAGIPLDQIHRELLEIFSVKGKYSLPQITAVTSWMRSELLDAKRIASVVYDEGPSDTNEDSDFDNPEKNSSRQWHVQQLLNHTTEDMRREMRYLMLPGKNDYDLRAFTAAGLQPQNFLTYIRGDHPKAVAQYIRNARAYGVVDRRVGDMGGLLLDEPEYIQGAYIDYFGQYSLGASKDLTKLPLDPNHYPICVGLNFKKGREHRRTKDVANEELAVREYTRSNLGSVRNGFDLLQLYLDAPKSPDEPLEMGDLRDDLIYSSTFPYMGIANQRNWTAADLLRKSTKSEPGNENFDDLPSEEQFGRVHHHMRNVVTALGTIDKFGPEMGIHGWLSEAAASAARGALNMPIVRHIARPMSYVSGESNNPFRSYFAVLETKRDQYQKHVKTIEFTLALYRRYITKFLSQYTGDNQVVIDVNSLLKVSGLGPQKRLMVIDGSKTTAEIRHEELLEATYELGISAASAQNPEDSYERHREGDLRRLEFKKDESAIELVKQQLIKHLIQRAGSRVQRVMSIGRNDTCPCGSGRKYKKCCMR